MTIVGEASIDIRPETGNFASEATSQLQAALPQIEIPVEAQVEQAASEIENINGTEVEIPVDANVEGAQSEIEGISGEEIEIPVTAELDDFEGALDEAVPSDLVVNITPQVSGDVSSQFGEQGAVAGDAFGGAAEGAMAGRFASLGAKAGPLAAAAAGVLSVKSAFDELRESEEVAAQLEARIKSTGGAANVTADDIDKLATSISSKTGIDDEAIGSGAALLLTFKNVRNEVGLGNDVFNRATETAADMSVTFKQDFSGSMIQLGKALDDPVRGITALRRVGVSFTEQQQEQIKTLVESGDTLKAQKLILAELETQVGGTADAVGETLGGSFDKMTNSLTETGGKLLDALPAEEALNLITDISDGIGGAIENFNGGDIEGAKAAMDDLRASLDQGTISSSEFSRGVDAIVRETPGALEHLAEVTDGMTGEFKVLGLAAEDVGGSVSAVADEFDYMALQTDQSRKTVARFAGMTGEELKEWRRDVGIELAGATEDFIDMGEDGKLSFRELMKGAKQQYESVENFADNLKILRKKDTSDGLIKWLTESGEVGVQAANVLARQSKRKIQAFADTRAGAKEMAAGLGESFGRGSAKAKDLQDRVGYLSADMRAMPKGVEVSFSSPGLSAAQTVAQAYLNTLREIERTFDAAFSGGGGGGGGQPRSSTQGLTPSEPTSTTEGRPTARPVPESGEVARARIEAAKPTPVKVTNSGVSSDSRDYRQRILGV